MKSFVGYWRHHDGYFFLCLAISPPKYTESFYGNRFCKKKNKNLFMCEWMEAVKSDFDAWENGEKDTFNLLLVSFFSPECFSWGKSIETCFLFVTTLST